MHILKLCKDCNSVFENKTTDSSESCHLKLTIICYMYTYFFQSKVFPSLSRNTLKKHSTSSVELARRCSEGKPFLEQNCRLHSLDSIFAIRATSVSLLNPCTLLMLLHIVVVTTCTLNYTNLHTYWFTFNRLKSHRFLSLCQGIKFYSTQWVHFWHIQN